MNKRVHNYCLLIKTVIKCLYLPKIQIININDLLIYFYSKNITICFLINI